MIIRELKSDDVREHDKVSSQAFVYDCDINDESSVLPTETMLGAFCDDGKTLMADIEIEDRKSTFFDGTLRCAAVGGVASKPEHRGKGAVKNIFNVLFEDERWDFSILYPFSAAYYSRLGYESLGRAITLTVPFSCFAAIERNSEAVLYEGGRDILDIYNKYAAETHICFLRDSLDAYPTEPYRESRYAYVWRDRAYVNFSIDRPKKTVNVKEIVYLDKESLLKILGFLRNFEGNQDTLIFEKLPLDTPIMNLVSDEKKCAVKCYSAGAARIHNVENVLKKIKYPEEKGAFAVKVGNEIFAVSFENGRGEVKKDSGAKPDVSFNINAASRVLLCGVNGRKELEYINGAEIIRDNPDFYRAFPKKDGFLNDDF